MDAKSTLSFVKPISFCGFLFESKNNNFKGKQRDKGIMNYIVLIQRYVHLSQLYPQ